MANESMRLSEAGWSALRSANQSDDAGVVFTHESARLDSAARRERAFPGTRPFERPCQSASARIGAVSATTEGAVGRAMIGLFVLVSTNAFAGPAPADNFKARR